MTEHLTTHAEIIRAFGVAEIEIEHGHGREGLVRVIPNSNHRRENMSDTLPTGAEEITWNLADLYAAIDDPAIERDLDRSDAEADALDAEYRGRIAGLDPAALAEMLAAYETLIERAYKAGNFAHLAWSADTSVPAHGALLQKITERGSRLSQKLVFLELELAAVPDEVAAAWLADPALARYRHWLELVRRYRPHMLTEPEEKILSEKAVTGRSAWVRFFDEVHSAARYTLDGQELARDQVLTRLYSPDRDLRRRAQEAVTAGLRDLRRTTTYIMNNVLADKASDDRLRHYPAWISSRNMSNEVDDRTVDALVEAVTSRYDIVARYYELKRRLLGADELFDYDRYAPLPAADHHYPWEQAREIVLGAYASFDQRMADIAALFFDRRWIDAAVRPGKRGARSARPPCPRCIRMCCSTMRPGRAT